MGCAGSFILDCFRFFVIVVRDNRNNGIACN
jgi:hypothetical protein